MPNRARDKILSRKKLRLCLRRHKQRGERIVFTSGCYDLLHIGHLRGFEQARKLGNRLVVGVNRDARVRQLKGRSRPLVSEQQRAEMVAGFEAVDYVVLFAEDTAAAVIRVLEPDVVCKGAEYRGDPPPEQQMIESLGGRFVLLREVPGVRSSSLLRRARRGSPR